MITTNPKLTKLRIIADRMKRHSDEAKRGYEMAWAQYSRACQEAGYCPACEKKKEECRCLWLANSTVLDPIGRRGVTHE